MRVRVCVCVRACVCVCVCVCVGGGGHHCIRGRLLLNTIPTYTTLIMSRGLDEELIRNTCRSRNTCNLNDKATSV